MYLFVFGVSALPAFMYVHPGAPQRPEEHTALPRIEVGRACVNHQELETRAAEFSCLLSHLSRAQFAFIKSFCLVIMIVYANYL